MRCTVHSIPLYICSDVFNIQDIFNKILLYYFIYKSKYSRKDKFLMLPENVFLDNNDRNDRITEMKKTAIRKTFENYGLSDKKETYTFL